MPALDAHKKHSIDVVVDRFKIKKICLQIGRVLGAALVLSEGLVEVISMDEANSRSYLYSEHWSCSQCDYSMPALEPRLFSFNSPVGACPSCDGLGVSQVIDPDKVVSDPNCPWHKVRLGHQDSVLLLLPTIRIFS